MEKENAKNYFAELNAVDVSAHTERKNGLTYLSWAWAWAEVKKRHPDAIYTIYENAAGWFYHTDGKTAWVKTGVTVEGVEHVEYLPVMDYKNRSIPADAITSFDVNKAIQRSLTKACARHGLGLYIYAGEDLPEAPTEGTAAPKRAAKKDSPALEAKDYLAGNDAALRYYNAKLCKRTLDDYDDATLKEIYDQLVEGGKLPMPR